jgi:PAS domain S-box-containing protein
MSTPLRLLIVEDLEDDALLIARELRHSGYDLAFERVDTPQAFGAMLAGQIWDVIIADYSMPRFSGLDALAMLKERGLDLPFIVVSGTIGEDIAVAAMKAGAHDYVMKDNLARLGPAVQRELHEAKVRLARKQAEEALRESNRKLALINRASQLLGSTLDLDQVLTTFLEQVRHLLNVVACSVWLIDTQSGELVCQQATGIHHEIVRGWRLPPGEGLGGWAIRSSKSLIVPDASADERHFRGIELQTGQALRSILSIPLRAQEKVIGVIQAVDTSVDRFKPDEVTLLESLAASAAAAIENARLYKETDRLRAFNENIVQSMEEGILLTDATMHITFVNPMATKLLGYPSEGLTGQPITTILAPGQIAKVEREIAKHPQTIASRYETVLLTRKGQRLAALFSTRSLFDEGDFIGVLIVFTDITERKRAERLLQTLNGAALAMQRALTREEIFTVVVEEFKKLGFSCMVFPTDESQSRLFTKYLSYKPRTLEAAEKMVGLKHEDFSIPIETVDVYRKVVWEKRTVFVRNAEEILRRLLSNPAERLAKQLVRMLKVSKSIVAPLIVEDEVIGVFSAQSDDLTEDDVPAITAFAHQMAAAWRKARLMQDLETSLEELKQTQAQFLQAQKMEAIGRLASGVAHDFNNVLTAIMGYTDLLLRDLIAGDPMQADLEEIRRAAGRAAALTRQLLIFSRKQVLQPKVLDLNAVVTDMENMLRRLLGENIDLITVLNPAFGRVKADQGQIEQVIMNLAVNARDAMSQGGQLAIETANVELDEAYARQHLDVQPGSYVMLAVSDNGCGMDAEIQSHLFEPFFTTKEHGKGTGLGLSTVYGIVKQSGGHIWVYSEPEQGTTFKIYLPRTEQAAGTLEPSITDVRPLRGSETILLVEDEDVVRALAQRVLRRQGYTVLEARHASKALQICKQHKSQIHLMVTDVVIPGGMSGRELAKRLVESRPGMRVLYMSGYTDNAAVDRSVLEEAFLRKPFTPDALVRQVREVLDTPQQK